MSEQPTLSANDYRIERTVLEGVKMPNGCGEAQKGAVCDDIRKTVANHGRVIEVDDNTGEERPLPEDEVSYILDHSCPAEE